MWRTVWRRSHLTLMMTSAQVVETSVTITDNSPSQDYTHPDDQTALLHVTPGFKPFTVVWRMCILMLECKGLTVLLEWLSHPKFSHWRWPLLVVLPYPQLLDWSPDLLLVYSVKTRKCPHWKRNVLELCQNYDIYHSPMKQKRGVHTSNAVKRI